MLDYCLLWSREISHRRPCSRKTKEALDTLVQMLADTRVNHDLRTAPTLPSKSSYFSIADPLFGSDPGPGDPSLHDQPLQRGIFCFYRAYAVIGPGFQTNSISTPLFCLAHLSLICISVRIKVSVTISFPGLIALLPASDFQSTGAESHPTNRYLAQESFPSTYPTPP